MPQKKKKSVTRRRPKAHAIETRVEASRAKQGKAPASYLNSPAQKHHYDMLHDREELELKESIEKSRNKKRRKRATNK